VAQQYDNLISQGRLDEAARELEQEGLHRRAAQLYEQLWDFRSAARAYHAAGDLPPALSNLLQLRDPGAVEALVAQVERANPSVAAMCATASEKRGAWLVAARLYRAGQKPEEAARCYEQAGELAGAAMLREELGQLKPAMDLYSRHLADLEQASSSPPAIAEPCFQLGRLLLRFGRAEEATPLLQRAWQGAGTPAADLRAGKAVVVALSRLGHSFGAEHALELLRARHPTADVKMHDCADDPDLAPVGPGGEEKVLAGRYRLGSLLGSGGMGRVYLAVDRLTEQRVAVKVFTAPGGARGRDAYRRFVREARTTGQLRHPHIVNLLDFHEEMGFMVLEYMEGGTLTGRLRPGVDLSTCRAVTLQVLAGLAAAHQRGIVHRDIKPSNIFFTTAGAAKLGDFGVAHLQDAGQTQTGAFIGTLAFMSPEQIKGEPVTYATDIYALGVTLFQMMTGQLPFTHPGLVAKHLEASPPAPSSVLSGLPPVCDETIARCLAKDPAQRYESLEALRRSVESFPAGDETAAPSVVGQQRAEAPAQQRRATDRRFSVESVAVDVGPLQVLAAQDTRLGRPVLLLRIAPGEGRAPLLHLLELAASEGGENLQRVLAIDHDKGQALLETSVGEHPSLPPSEGPDGQLRLRMAEQIGLALAPLHAAGQVHGGITPDQISQLGDTLVLGLIGALVARASGSPLPAAGDEIAAVVLNLGLAGAPPLPHGSALADWARRQREERANRTLEEKQRALMQQVLAHAPPGVEGG